MTHKYPLPKITEMICECKEKMIWDVSIIGWYCNKCKRSTIIPLYLQDREKGINKILREV